MSIHHLNLLRQPARQQIIKEISELVLPKNPFFSPVMKNGSRFRYQMTNCGELGWVSDKHGYRYQAYHPENNNPWVPLIPSLQSLVEFLKLQGYINADYNPQSCLINKYLKGQNLGLHQDNSEKDWQSPIISISLGAPGIFQLGGLNRSDRLEDIILEPGDIFIMGGEDRMRFHAFKGISAGEKRINLTIRQVSM